MNSLILESITNTKKQKQKQKLKTKNCYVTNLPYEPLISSTGETDSPIKIRLTVQRKIIDSLHVSVERDFICLYLSGLCIILYLKGIDVI